MFQYHFEKTTFKSEQILGSLYLYNLQRKPPVKKFGVCVFDFYASFEADATSKNMLS